MLGALFGMHHAVEVHEQGLSRLHIAHKAVARAFQGHRFAGHHHFTAFRQVRLAVAHRTDAVGVAEGDQAIAGDQADHGVRTLDALVNRTHGGEHRRRGQRQLATRQLQLVSEHVEQHLGVAVGVEVAAVDVKQLFAQRVGVGQVAVVHQHQTEGSVHIEGLSLFLVECIARGRIAHLAQAHRARQRAHVAGAEHVLDHAACLVHEELAPMRIRAGRHDACCVLTAVLQEQQRVINQLIDGRLGNHTNDAAHGSPLPKKQSSSRIKIARAGTRPPARARRGEAPPTKFPTSPRP